MDTTLRQFLTTYKKKTVTLEQLEQASHSSTYSAFAKHIQQLEVKGVLQPIKARGINTKTPPLSLSYRISKHPLQTTFHEELVAKKRVFHPLLQIERYFQATYEQWQRDVPYLNKINYYLQHNPLPKTYAAAPERSFELVANEKWITDHGGKELLEYIGLWNDLLIIPVADPLMFALNPKNINNDNQYHLIVENKTTYQALLPVLEKTPFATLIYGSGSKIEKSIENFYHQYPLTHSKYRHVFYYYGDIDYEGISIWYRLTRKGKVLPALPFYEAALIKEAAIGKANQLRNEEALTAFVRYFTEPVQQQISEKLQQQHYYPQEILTTAELQTIWREAHWTTMDL